MKKKIIIVALAMVMLLGLTGCSDSKEDETTAYEPPTLSAEERMNRWLHAADYFTIDYAETTWNADFTDDQFVELLDGLGVSTYTVDIDEYRYTIDLVSFDNTGTTPQNHYIVIRDTIDGNERGERAIICPAKRLLFRGSFDEETGEPIGEWLFGNGYYWVYGNIINGVFDGEIQINHWEMVYSKEDYCQELGTKCYKYFDTLVNGNFPTERIDEMQSYVSGVINGKVGEAVHLGEEENSDFKKFIPYYNYDVEFCLPGYLEDGKEFFYYNYDNRYY